MGVRSPLQKDNRKLFVQSYCNTLFIIFICLLLMVGIVDLSLGLELLGLGLDFYGLALGIEVWY